jgi:protoporphyrinogen oxidase
MHNPRSSWSRRQIMRTLAAAAATPALRSANSPLRTTGIIGAGMAGVSLAWLLDGQRQIVLLEAQPQIGGSVESVTVDLDGQSFVVDIGAQYFNPGPYPTYVKLLSLLGITDQHSFATSITVFDPSDATPSFVSPLFPQRTWPLLASWNTAGIKPLQPRSLPPRNAKTTTQAGMSAWKPGSRRSTCPSSNGPA